MVIKKRCLLWDWTNTHDVPQAIEKVNFKGPLNSCSNWNAWKPIELKDRLPFQPMIRTEAQLSGNEWNSIKSHPTSATVHFFNEPERQNITPERAADIWNKQLLPLRKEGHKLVSPSCANDAKGQSWIIDFMHRVSDNPPDYLGLHYYGTEARDAISFLESMHTKFPKISIIVSEIASIHREYSHVLDFTVQVTNWMDNASYVHQYGWFGCMRQPADSFVSPAAQLMNPDGTFTDLMWKIMYDQPMKLK